MYGGDNVTASPPLTFGYQEKAFEFGPIESRGGLESFLPEQASGFVDAEDPTQGSNFQNVSVYPKNKTLDLFDFDGDGLPDRLFLNIINWSNPRQGESADEWWMQRNNGAGFLHAVKLLGFTPKFKTLNQTWTAIDNRGFSTALTLTRYFEPPITVLRSSMVDMDGDGKIDRVVSDSADLTKLFVSKNTGGDLAPEISWGGIDNQLTGLEDYSGVSRQASYNGSACTTIRMMDMNGDGRPDRVMMRANGTFVDYLVQLNTGSGFATPSLIWSGVTPEFSQWDWAALDASTPTYPNYTYASMIDINGDGLPDRVNKDGTSLYDHFTIQFNNGSGFDAPEPWGPVDSQGYTSSPEAAAIARTIFISRGSGDDNPDPIFYCQIVGMIDINGDGLPDRVMRKVGPPYTHLVVQLNTGSGFGSPMSMGNLSSTDDEVFNGLSVSHYFGGGYLRMLDINGDGLVDRVMKDMATPSGLNIQTNKGPFPDLLCSIDNGFGGKVNISYVPSTSFVNKDHAGRNTLPFPVNVVSTITQDDGIGSVGTYSYSYTGGYYDGTRREFHGFHSVTQFDPTGIKTVTYYHQDGGYERPESGEYNDAGSHAKHGIPFRIDRYGTDRRLYSSTVNKVEELQIVPGVWFPFISTTINFDYPETAAVGVYRATAVSTIYDGIGNPKSINQLGEVTVQPNPPGAGQWYTLTDVKPNENLWTLTTYASISGNPNIRNKPELITISATSSSSGRIRESRFYYDSQGNVRTNQVWLDKTDVWQTVPVGYVNVGRATYDQYGNPTEVVNSLGITNVTTYDSFYRTFPVQSDSRSLDGAITLTTKKFFNILCGQEIGSIDPNGAVSTNLLDSLYRVTETRVNASPFEPASSSLWRTKISYALNGMANGVSANFVKVQHFDGTDLASGRETYVYVDGTGKPIQKRTECETNGWYRVSDTLHDTAGRARFELRPYFSQGSAFTSLNGTYIASYSQIDGIGRPWLFTPITNVTVTAWVATPAALVQDADSPTGLTETTYSVGTDPWVVSVTDAEGKISRTWHDEFGRAYGLENNLNGTKVNVWFYYDRVGNLIGSYDALVKWSKWEYNSLGWKLSSSDPNMGFWLYYYDTAGRLLTQEDAAGNATQLAYADYFGRKSKKEVFNNVGALVSTTAYSYDNSVYAGHSVFKGQLASIADASGTQYFGYDFKGRVLKNTRVLARNGQTYTVAQAYDDADHVATLTYPFDTASIRYIYANGLLKQVESIKGTGANKEVFYKVTSLNEFEQPEKWQTHNQNVDSSVSFFPMSHRVQQRKTSKGLVDLQKLSYTYNKVSNIKSIVDGVNAGPNSGSMSAITYDDLHRLTSVTYAGSTKSVTYNVGGDILTNGEFGSGTYSYTPNHPNAVASANGKAYTYDANGNMITRSGQTLQYNPENRLVRVTTAPNVNVDFGYDDSGERLWKSSANGLTVWVGGCFEERGGVKLCDVTANGLRICTFEPQAGGPYALNGRDESFRMMAYSTVNAIARAFEWCFEPGRTAVTALASACTLALALWVGYLATAGQRRVQPVRGFRPGLFRQLITFATVVALLFGSTNTNVYASPTNPVLLYYCTDHLGSSKITTDRSGATIFNHLEYGAFGKKYVDINNNSNYIPGPLSNQFTGQVADEETGLVYYGARYYDPELGRFVQPDPSGATDGTTQSFNRYSYCGNNPLNNTDPSGYSAFPTGGFPGLSSFGGGLPGFDSFVKNPFDRINQDWGFSMYPDYNDNFGYRGFGGGSSYDPFELAGVPSPSTLMERIANPHMSPMEREVLGPLFADHPSSEGMTWMDLGKAALTLASFVPGPIGITAGVGLAAIDASEGNYMGAAIGIGAAVLGLRGLAPEGRAMGAFATEGRGTAAAKAAVPRNPNVYEALFEAPISGTTRSAHRASANRYLANELQQNADLANMMNQQFGGNVLEHMKSGRKLLNPPGTVWHHPANNPNMVQLLRRSEHTAPSLQPVLHPGGIGGFRSFYGP